ncbi:TPA: YopX family protein [Enterococcus faecalis]
MIPKFRAWDKRSKEMWKVSTLHIEDEYADLFKKNIYENPLNDPSAKFGDVILMQSTGLKDKNGVEIFEGDVVKVTDGESEEDSYVSAVRNYSNEGYPAFDIEYPPTYHYDSNVLSAIMCNGFETIEVIGNLWDNPELLEGIES